MTTKTRALFCEVGQHSSTDPSDFDSAPSVVFLRPVGEVVPTDGYEALDRDVENGNGEPVASIQGPQKLEVPNMSFELTGLSAGGAGNTTDSSGLSTGLDTILECLVGAVATDDTGEQTGVSPGSGTTVTTSSTAFTNDGGIAFATATAGNIVCRAVVSTSGNDITIERAPTDLYGATEAPAASSDVYAMRRYAVTPSNANPLHFYVDLEGASWRREYYGCQSDWSLEFPSGGIAKLNLTGTMCMKWADSAEQTPTYSAATTGSPIVVNQSSCWIDSTLYQAYGLTIEGGNTIAPRTADGGEQGNFGYVVTSRRPRMKFKLRSGALTSPNEATDANLATFRGDTTVDLAFQFGSAAGGLMYVRARSANITAGSPYTADNGQLVIDVEAECTGSEPLDIYVG